MDIEFQVNTRSHHSSQIPYQIVLPAYRSRLRQRGRSPRHVAARNNCKCAALTCHRGMVRNMSFLLVQPILTSRMKRSDWLQATASIMAGNRLVRWEVCGAMPGLPGLTPHAYIPIDSNTGHVRVRVKTEADKEYCKTECCRHHTGRQPASHANEWPL